MIPFQNDLIAKCISVLHIMFISSGWEVNDMERVARGLFR
jgi:hypothetical protein